MNLTDPSLVEETTFNAYVATLHIHSPADTEYSIVQLLGINTQGTDNARMALLTWISNRILRN